MSNNGTQIIGQKLYGRSYPYPPYWYTRYITPEGKEVIWFSRVIIDKNWKEPDIISTDYHGWLLKKIWWTYDFHSDNHRWYGMEIHHSCSLDNEVVRCINEPFDRWECKSCGEMVPLRARNFLTNFSKLAVTM